MSSPARTVRGTIEFLWEDPNGVLINLEPDTPGAPHTFEVAGELRERLAAELAEGDRVEVVFIPVEHEVVDPDAGPSETSRAEVREVRMLER